jgi:hypothetical protein
MEAPFTAFVRARMLLLADRHLRVDLEEAAAVVAGMLEGVDLEHVGEPDPGEVDRSTPEPVTPIERLVATPGVIVSRDFRAAGKGAEWDRCRKYDPKIHGYPVDKSRGQARGVLPWRSIDTLVLHTAGTEGLHPDRWLGVPCHNAVANDATIVLCHRLDAYLWASHASNRRSVSLEVAGNRTITPAQAVAARALARYNVEELRRKRPLDDNGEPLPLYVRPHRLTHKSRAVDTDPAIWREVGEYCIDELGLKLGKPLGSGLAFDPKWWSPGRAA